MARHYAQIKTSIWRPDDDFCKLPAAAQHMFFVLATQGDITAAGTLPLTIKRWARQTADATLDSVTAALQLLSDARYIVIDFDTEELLIRTFIKADNGYSNEKRRGAIKDSAAAVASPALKGVIADELFKLGLTQIALTVNPYRASTADDEGTERASQNLRVVVTKDELLEAATHNPQPATLIPETATPEGEPPTFGSATPQQDFCDKHMPDGTDEPCGRCAGIRKRKERQQSERERRQVAEKNRLAEIRANCPDCDAGGWRANEAGDLVLRCLHPKTQPQSRRTA